MVLIVWLIMARTGLGFQIRSTGLNANAARMSGMSIKRVTVLSFAIGGACAGMAGSVYSIGVANGTLAQGFSANFGYLGIAVALVARLNPAWVLPSAFFFAVLRVGGANLTVQTGLSNTISDLLVAVLVILLLAFKVIRLRYAEAVQD
jgi:simple sugar transport system permease protein